MLSNLFFSLLKINATATIVAVIVLALKYVLKKCGASRKLLFYLWIIIALRFVCPNFIESDFSLFNIFDTPISEENQITISNNNQITNTNNFIPTNIDFNTNNTILNDAAVNTEINENQTIIPSESSLKEHSNKFEITEVLMLIWIAGSLCMILYTLISYFKLKKTVMFAVKKDEGYYETDMISTPCVLGIIKPKIYITLGLTEKEKKYILTHENIHIRRKDYFTKFIAYMILAMHWVNPISWILFKMFVSDMEMLCDEESIKKLGNENKVGYMESLISLSSRNMKNILSCPIAFSENNTEKRVKNMIKYKKSSAIISIVALIVCMIIAAICLTNGNKHEMQNSLNVVPIKYDYLLKGKNGSSLFIDSISSDEYKEMMKILYPNDVVDEQGLEIGSVQDVEAVRAKYIEEHTKAYTKLDDKIVEVELEPFYVNIADRSNGGEYEYLFYKARIEKDTFVFPSEYGNTPFGFIAASKENTYIVYSDLGIWKINLENLNAEKLTSDEFNGESYEDIRTKFNGHLFWVDNVSLSPNADYLVYGTNKDATNINEISIWKIDIKTNKEEQILAPDLYNNIVGFISDDAIVVGSTENTRLININNKIVKSISLPKVSHLSIRNVKDGKLIYSSYEDDSSTTKYVVSEVDLSDGTITKLNEYDALFSEVGAENVENLSDADLIYLQNEVDNGHYPWRLDPENVARQYLYNIYEINAETLSDIAYKNSGECTLNYRLNEAVYTLSLSKLYKKDNTGIWFIKDFKAVNGQNIDIDKQEVYNSVSSSLYEQTEEYLKNEFYRVYTPYYEILDLEISNWSEDGDEATFFYTMTFKNYDKDPDTVAYIKETKEEGNIETYEKMKKEYLEPKEANYEFKIIMDNSKINLYSNTAVKGTYWEPTIIDEYVFNGVSLDENAVDNMNNLIVQNLENLKYSTIAQNLLPYANDTAVYEKLTEINNQDWKGYKANWERIPENIVSFSDSIFDITLKNRGRFFEIIDENNLNYKSNISNEKAIEIIKNQYEKVFEEKFDTYEINAEFVLYTDFYEKIDKEPVLLVTVQGSSKATEEDKQAVEEYLNKLGSNMANEINIDEYHWLNIYLLDSETGKEYPVKPHTEMGHIAMHK